MRKSGRRRSLAVLIGAVFALFATAVPSQALGLPDLLGGHPTYPGPTAHPRLLFAKSDLPTLNARIATSSTLSAALTRLKQKADGHMIKVQPEVVRANIGIPYNLQGLEKPYTLQNEMSAYLIELGMTYQLTGDTRYGRRVADLLLALADAKFPFWSGQDLGIGDLDEGLGLGFDLAYELMTPAERLKFVSAVTASQELLFVTPLFKYTNQASTYVTSNWLGVLGGGAGLLLLAIKGEPGAPNGYNSPARAAVSGTVPAFPATYYVFNDYVTAATNKVRDYFVNGVDPEGANHEGHTYSHYGLKNSVPYAKALKRETGTDLIAGTGLSNLARWSAFEQLPGGAQQFVPLNDSQRNEFGVDYEALLFGIAPNNGVTQWLWNRTVGALGNNYDQELRLPGQTTVDTGCVFDRPLIAPVATPACVLFHTNGDVWELLFYRTPGETPEVSPQAGTPLSMHYAQNGLVDARTGFDRGSNEVISTFTARRNGIGHFQLDAGSFTIYGEGVNWAIDPGYSCIGCGDNSPNGYPIAHNEIVIDDGDTQDINSRYYTGTTIDSFINAQNFSLSHANLNYAYSGTAPYAGRDHLFIRTPGRPTIVVTLDQLKRSASGNHTYAWQFLTDRTNVPQYSGPTFTLSALNGAKMVGRAAASGTEPTFGIRVQVLQNNNDDIGPYAVMQTKTAAQPAIDQLTGMAISASGQAAATSETLAVTGGNAIAFAFGGLRDVIVSRHVGSSAVTGPAATDGSFGKLTENRGESLLRAGTSLSAFGTNYITVTGTQATVTVSGSKASAVGAASNTYTVFAPQTLSTVTVNGAPVTSCRTGQFVSFPC